MKRYYKNLILGIAVLSPLVLSFTSCSSYLDVDKYFDDVLTLDTAFA